MIKATKDLGIWMDNAQAYLTEFTTNPICTTTITSGFSHHEKSNSTSRSEATLHHKEQHDQTAYYKELGEHILEFDRVILFGPTHAKNELRNMLKANHHFDKIGIEVESTDKMTEHEQQVFVRAHFSKK